MKKTKTTWLMSLVLCLLMFGAFAQTTVINGLTVIVEFTDAPFIESNDSVSLMINQVGFNGWGNKQSVRDYYIGQSAGKVLLSTTVARVSLPHTVAYYYDDKLGNDISDVVDALNAKYPAGFQNLSVRPDGGLTFFHIVCKAGKGAWQFGPQPGSNTLKNNGADVLITWGNNTTYDRNQQPQPGTICHETGHSVMNWGDYYNPTEINGATNLGHYCVMGSGGDKHTAMPVCAPLRYRNNWINTVTELTNVTREYTVVSNSRTQVFKYTNVNNPREYFMIEALYTNGNYLPIDGEDFTCDQGLAVWYVDEQRGLYKPTALPDGPSIKLIQADGLDEMHDPSKDGNIFEQKRDLRGDMNDMFDNLSSTLSAATHPFYRWKDGSEPGLTITNISAPGATMKFTVQARPNTITSQPAYVDGGTISPAGLIGYASNTSKTFTIVPEMGYAVANVIVDGISKGSITSYSFTNATGNHTISATFQKSTSADPVPSPWQEAEIGSARKAGAAGYRNGVFGLESNHYDIWGTEDGLNFIYQSLNGNGEIVAKINKMNNPNDWSKAGIMMRESTAPNSKHFMLAKTPGNNFAPQMRYTTGSDSYHNPQNTSISGDYNKYSWVKIVRQGNTFTSYISLTGTSNWIQLASSDIPMNATILVGMCATAGTDIIGTKITFNNVSVTSSAIAPVVSITSPGNNAGFNAPASITITANASDANGTVTKVEFYNGSTKLGEDLSSPFSFNWTSVPNGTHSLTAKATDNSNLSTVSSAVTIVVNGAANADICFEAEAALGQGTFAPFQVVSDANASGGKYIVVPTGGNQGSPPANSIATYSFNVPATSNYNIWVRVIAPTSNDNSMYIRTDANAYASWTPGTYTSWTWKRWTSKSLSAGNHTLSVARNEDGLRIDKILLTINGSTPTGLGCGSLAREEFEETDMNDAEGINGNQLILAPNPSSSVFSVISSPGAISSISIMNAYGAEVYRNENADAIAGTEFGSNLANGMYTVLVKYQDGKTEIVKIVKTR